MVMLPSSKYERQNGRIVMPFKEQQAGADWLKGTRAEGSLVVYGEVGVVNVGILTALESGCDGKNRTARNGRHSP